MIRDPGAVLRGRGSDAVPRGTRAAVRDTRAGIGHGTRAGTREGANGAGHGAGGRIPHVCPRHDRSAGG